MIKKLKWSKWYQIKIKNEYYCFYNFLFWFRGYQTFYSKPHLEVF